MRKCQQLPSNIFANLEFLNKISQPRRSIPFIRNQLALATAEQLLIFAEIATNILAFNFSLTTRQLRLLTPHAVIFRQLSKSTTPEKARQLLLANPSIVSPLIRPIVHRACQNKKEKTTVLIE